MRAFFKKNITKAQQHIKANINYWLAFFALFGALCILISTLIYAYPENSLLYTLTNLLFGTYFLLMIIIILSVTTPQNRQSSKIILYVLMLEVIGAGITTIGQQNFGVVTLNITSVSSNVMLSNEFITHSASITNNIILLTTILAVIFIAKTYKSEDSLLHEKVLAGIFLPAFVALINSMAILYNLQNFYILLFTNFTLYSFFVSLSLVIKTLQ
jgi:hypothetical protein